MGFYTRPIRGRFLEGSSNDKHSILERSRYRIQSWSSRAGSLLILSPLRTVRAPFNAHCSSREPQSRHRVPFLCSTSPFSRYSGQAIIKYFRMDGHAIAHLISSYLLLFQYSLTIGFGSKGDLSSTMNLYFILFVSLVFVSAYPVLATLNVHVLFPIFS